MPALTAATNFASAAHRSFFPSRVSGRPSRRAKLAPVIAVGARSAIGLQDIAIDPDRAWPEFFKIDNRSQRSANQTLDLALRPSSRPFVMSRGFRVCVEYGSIEYFGGKPAAGHALFFHPARHSLPRS